MPLLTSFLRLLVSRSTLLLGGLLLVGAAIWFGVPLLPAGSARALVSRPVLIFCIAGLLLASACYGVYRLLRKLSEDPAFFRGFQRLPRTDTEHAAKKNAVAALEPKLLRTLARLRAMGESGMWRRCFESRRHLYALPWFLVMGPAGAGKTALLRQSGLQFPLTQGSGNPLQAAVPTADCDWWLSNQAVMLDTSGRYCQPGASEPSDGAGSAGSAGLARVQWPVLLGLLRKHRPRAPVNGVLLVVSVAELLDSDAAARAQLAVVLRERLAGMRRDLGICFPVYLVVAKMDQLRGFGEFFQSLTSEGRTQAWGFSLDAPTSGRPWRSRPLDPGDGQALRQQVAERLEQLKLRLNAGLRVRLHEEFEVDRRQQLFTLPLEMAALGEALKGLVDAVFLDSRFDDTADPHALRGVYFSSAGQGSARLTMETGTLMQQLARTMHEVPQAPDTALHEHQSFFLHDLLARIVVPGAHLVRPNRRWEIRFRLLRLLGHSLALLVSGWLAFSFATSWRNNLAYLDAVEARTLELRGKVVQLLAEPTRANVPAVLDAARLVPAHPLLGDAAQGGNGSPPASFGYGLYVAEPLMAASAGVYAGLQEHLLLPAVLQRMQVVLAARLRENDAPGVYATLRVYKLLNDKTRYRAEGAAAEVRDWVLADIATTQGAAALGVGDATAAHVRSLFSGARPMEPGSPPNQNLIRQAQAFLDSRTAGQRLYERARTAFQKDAPPDFTLVRAVGPQAGTVFSREGGMSLESGVPGLFTYDGYHGLFDKRLAAFIGRAFPDDAWVMDRSDSEQALAGRPSADQPLPGGTSADPMVEEVRRQYLAEYVEHWDDFLGSIRAVGTTRSAQASSSTSPAPSPEPAGGSLGFDLSVLRQLAAPDSPLIRLARAAARETTLSRTPSIRAPDPAPPPASTFALAPVAQRQESLEKTLVDAHFAALHELVTGQTDAGSADSGGLVAGAAARPGLDAVSVVINEFYTQLVVADTALAAGSLPPAGNDAGARLMLEAGKLPPPLREVLLALARNGGARVGDGAGTILRRHAQQELDRLLGLLAQNVGEPCRRGIEGRYPFAASGQDAAIEDVTQMFGAGGAADDFFQRHLAPFVDTSARPWRYRTGTNAIALALPPLAGTSGIALPVAVTAAATAAANGIATVTGPTLEGEWLKLLAQGGPDLDTFYRAQKIRDLFYRQNGGGKLGWKLEITVLDLDPTITDLVIDIDGQALRYRHGPPQPLKIEWPGPRGGSIASLTANPQISGATSVLSVDGPWALLHLLDKGRVLTSATAGRVSLELGFDGRKALLGIGAGSQPNPLNSDVLRGFHCPGMAT